MSQDYHHNQGIFSFSNGFHRPSSSHQEEVEESAVSGAPIPVYETAGMLSEMFSYPGGGSGEILDHSTKQLLEQQNRHNNNSTLHMLLPNHHQGYGYANEQQQHHFTWPSSSDHQSQGDMIGTVHVEGGKGLSLSLSSSLEAVAAAKAEEYRSIYCAAVDGTSSSSNASVHHHQFNQLKTLLLDNSSSHQHQVMGHFGSSSSSPMAASSSIGGIYTLRNSKYTKPAQELLEEFCSVGRGHNFKKNKLSRNNSNPNTSGCGGGGGGGGGGSSSSAGAANDNPPLSPADRIEHQRRKVKLLSMLEEVTFSHYILL